MKKILLLLNFILLSFVGCDNEDDNIVCPFCEQQEQRQKDMDIYKWNVYIYLKNKTNDYVWFCLFDLSSCQQLLPKSDHYTSFDGFLCDYIDYYNNNFNFADKSLNPNSVKWYVINKKQEILYQGEINKDNRVLQLEIY